MAAKDKNVQPRVVSPIDVSPRLVEPKAIKYPFGGTPTTPPFPTKSPMYLEAAEANSTVSMVSTLATAPNLEYSTDGVTWQAWEYTTSDDTHTFDTVTLTAVGDRVYLRGDNPNGLALFPEGAQMPNFSNFILDGAINGGGNVMSLLDKTMALTEVPQFGLLALFSVLYPGLEPALLTPPAMDTITSIGDRGCYGMYSVCSSLIAAADMPLLTTIGEEGCDGMYVATSITAAADMPVLTDIGENGCHAMYVDCTFDISDDGETLNFAFPAPPVTAGETTYATAYDVADWMGNINGFTNP